jgi:hypothetical protein
MKLSTKDIVSWISLTLTTAIGPQTLAQTQPAAPLSPAQIQQLRTQQQPQTNQQYQHPKARGAAGGAVIETAAGNAAAGAVIGAGHSRREQRRSNRRGQ